MKGKEKEYCLIHFINFSISIIMILKLKKRHRKKLPTNTPHACRHKNLQQNISKPNPAIYKKGNKSQPSGIYPGDALLIQHSKFNVIHLITILKLRNHMPFSVDTEKIFGKI